MFQQPEWKSSLNSGDVTFAQVVETLVKLS